MSQLDGRVEARSCVEACKYSAAILSLLLPGAVSWSKVDEVEEDQTCAGEEVQNRITDQNALEH